MTTLIAMASLALAGSALATPTHFGPKITRQDTTTDPESDLSVAATNITVASNITLQPLPMERVATDSAAVFAPQNNVMLPYGLNDTNYLNITLTMPNAVLLEALAGLKNVDCEATSATMEFDTVAEAAEAYTEWSKFTDLVLVTNHLGDCDDENERGFFVANSFSVSETTVVAEVAKTNVTRIASYMRANFTGLPGTDAYLPNADITNTTTTLPKRGITIDPDAIGVSATWDLPTSQTIFELDPFVTATAQSGSLGMAVSLDGYLDFDVLSFSLDALYVDASASANVDMALELEVWAPYAGNFSYANAIAYYVIDVPGLLTFGPELGFSVGADVNVDTAVDIVVSVGAELANGTVHLDFVGDDTAMTGWVPTYYANLSFSDDVAITVAPFAEITVGLDFKILGGLVDLSGGITPRIEFPVSAALNGTQSVNAATNQTTVAIGAVNVTHVEDSGDCVNGLYVKSEFGFDLRAFVTSYWDVDLYSVTVPISDQCYSWA